jgi:pimeloyl-ACP methyl ester carboxylesterase
MVLAHDVYGSKAPVAPVAMLLHGILGSKKNWASVARRLVERDPARRVITVDLRGHGSSHDQPPPNTVDACASDVAELCAHLGEEPTVLSGHSFGGKVALLYAQRYAAELASLLVLDSNPGTGRGEDAGAADGRVDEVKGVIDKVSAVPLPIEGRQELIAHLTGQGLSLGLARWMTTNVVRKDEGLMWAFDLDVVRALLADYATIDAWSVLQTPPSGVLPFIVRGARSDRWSDDDLKRLDAINTARPGAVTVLEGAGHWVHADDLEGTLAAIERALQAAA